MERALVRYFCTASRIKTSNNLFCTKGGRCHYWQIYALLTIIEPHYELSTSSLHRLKEIGGYSGGTAGKLANLLQRYVHHYAHTTVCQELDGVSGKRSSSTKIWYWIRNGLCWSIWWRNKVDEHDIERLASRFFQNRWNNLVIKLSELYTPLSISILRTNRYLNQRFAEWCVLGYLG